MWRRRKKTKLNKREQPLLWVCWSMRWVRVADRPSDWVTENRCERNLQLPWSAKQHHQSWQGLCCWSAGHFLYRRVKWLGKHAGSISAYLFHSVVHVVYGNPLRSDRCCLKSPLLTDDLKVLRVWRRPRPFSLLVLRSFMFSWHLITLCCSS